MRDLDTRSYWLGLDRYTPNPPLAGDGRVDVALLGGGFTGLWSAYLLLKESPDLRIAILEANAIGYGASGRNGGFAMTKVHHSLAELAEELGDEDARRVHLAARRAVQLVTELARSESIACDLQPNGLLMLSNSPAQDARAHRELETASRLGVEDAFTYLDRSRAQERIHSERIRCGFREEHCTLLNPARLARGLKRVVEGLGGRVYEGTPVTDWEERRDCVLLRTPGGTLTADRAIIGPNAYGTAWRATRRRLLPFYTYICLTRPLTGEEWDRIGWKGREGAEDLRRGIHYFRPTADGRILWGGRDARFRPDGPSAKYDVDEACFRRLRESFEWFFPQLSAVPFEHRWGGPIALTGRSIPGVGWFDAARRRAAFAYGYNGHGVAISHLAARALADLLADRKSDWTDLWFVGRAPPDMGPSSLVRNALVRMAARAVFRADDAEREGLPLALRLMNRLARGRA